MTLTMVERVSMTQETGSCADLQDVLFCPAVQSGSCFIAHEYTGVLQECTGERNSLLFSPTQLQASLSHPQVVPIWHPHDHVMDRRLPGSLLEQLASAWVSDPR